MKFLLVLILLASITLAGCTSMSKTISEVSVKSYLFEKERVDQTIEGNQGYITGTPPEAVRKEIPKRTLIGMDIEIPILPGEKAQKSPKAGVIYEEDIKMTPKKTVPERVVEEEITEEEWIK